MKASSLQEVCIRILDIISDTPEANPISRLTYSDVKDWIVADEGTPVVEAFTNKQLIKCCKLRNYISIRKVSQRLSWLGHIERMQGTRMVKAIYSWKPISRRPTGRPKICWGDDVRKDIQKIKVPNWKTLAKDRRRWKELVEKA